MGLHVILIGGGGHARVLIDVLQELKVTIVGITDPAHRAGATGPNRIAMLGGDEALDRFHASEIQLVNGVGSIGSMTARDDVFRRCAARGFRFANVVHPATVISRSAELCEGAQVMAGCVVQCGAVIGRNTIINTHASIDHDCRIGESVHVAPGVTLSGSVTIGDRTHIGTGATVIQGIKIGAGCLVAAGAVVHRDLPDNSRLIPGK
jgi:sugar O-acyltransferase (sialic acid O-acetyltransferase NeuD family)